jgi:hypothetical protein
MTDISIESTYKGFRLQALYILYLALTSDKSWYYIPEKTEDLTIQDADRKTKKLVQIKSRSRNISLSTFKPQQKDGFFKRVERNIKNNNDIEISVECFGTISPELVQAFNEGDKRSQQKIKEKFIEYKFSDRVIDSFFNKIRFNEQEEKTILKKAKGVIKSTIGGAKQEVTIDLLTKWIYDFSEKQRGFNKSLLVSQIHRIGEFLKDLRAHQATWFTVIKPFSEFSTKDIDKEVFEDSFSEGTNARFEHVLLNLDVIRTQKLEQINNAFKKKNIVVVHGASGQGKTTLALRYIKEYHPLDFSFYIKKISDFDASVNISNALLGYASKLDIPILIYYDVEAYNPNWINVLSELTGKKNIIVLITIREENWRMSDIDYHSFPYKDIELDFNKEEAQEIFKIYSQKYTVPTDLNFQDSWNNFGGKGPLLEYVYYLRKTDTFKSRLKQQIYELEKRKPQEYLEFLAVISLVTKYGVRIDLKKLLELLAVTQPKAPRNLLYELEKEYFINIVREVEPNLVEALHPIRSNVIFEILFQEDILDWFEYFKKSIELCHGKDLQFFLLNIIYDNFDSRDKIVSFLMGYKLKTWNELHAIFRALQWTDIKNYYLLNKHLISEIYEKLGRAWYAVLDINISRIKSVSKWPFVRNFDEMSKDLKLEYEDFNQRQSTKLEAFKISEQFLKGISDFDLGIKSDEDWLKVSEVVFLSYHFRVPTSLDSFIGNVDYDIFLSIPIEILSKIILAFLGSKNNYFTEWYTKNKKKILNKYKQEMSVERISEEAEAIKIDYFVKGLNISDEGMESTVAHNENLKKLNVLREIVPDKKEYSSDGYAQIFITDDQPDELHKKLNKENLIPGYLPEINSIFSGVANYNFRLKDWGEYYQSVISQRIKLIENLEEIFRELKKYFFKKKISDRGFVDEILERFNEIEREISHPVLFPKTAVDKFGIFFEEKYQFSYNVKEKAHNTNKNNHNNHKNVKAKFEFDRKYRDYFDYLKYFLQKAKIIFLYNSMMSKGDKRVFNNLEPIKNLIPKPDDYKHITHLSIMNLKDAYKHLRDYQGSFRELFDQYITGDEERYNELEAREIENFNMLLPSWYHFTYFPKKTFPSTSWLKASYINDYLSGQLKKLKDCIGRCCVDDYFIKGCFETIVDGENSVVFQCDLNSPTNIDDSLRRTEKALFKYFKDFSYTSIDFCIMDIFRKQFVFLFTFKNKAFLDAAYRVTLHDLKNKQSILENILLSEKFQEKSFYKNLGRFDDEFIKCSTRAVSALSQFINVLLRLKDSRNFPFEDEITNYEYVNTMLKELDTKFKEVFSLLEDIDDQYKKNAHEPPQALKDFRGYFSLRSTQDNSKTIEISSDKFDEIIERTLALVGGVSDNMLIYIKNRYGD